MKMKLVKSIANTLLISTALATSALANQGKPHQTVEQAAKRTRDSLNLILDRMHTRVPEAGSPLVHADYEIVTQAMNDRLRTAVSKFRQTVTAQILPKLDFSINIYREISQSNRYPADRKKALLEASFQNIQSEAMLLQKDYQHAIFNLYSALGDYTLTFEGLGMYCSALTSPELNSCNLSGVRSNGQSISEIWKAARAEGLQLPSFLSQVTQEMVRAGCRSQTCMVLYGRDLIEMASLIHTELDQPIAVTLFDQKELVLDGPSIPLTGKVSVDGYSNRWDLIGIIGQLPSSDEYAVLPFDINEDDLARTIQKQKTEDARSETLKRLTQQRSAILQKLGDAIQKCNEIPKDVRALTAQLCELGASDGIPEYTAQCMTDSEEVHAKMNVLSNHPTGTLRQIDRYMKKIWSCYLNNRRS